MQTGQATEVHAQVHQMVNYTIKDGLPSPETYFVHNDEQGYLWIGTDRGLARFNGRTIETFTTDNSALTGNTIFKVFEAGNGELWFTCYNGSITIYDLETGQFRPFEHNVTLMKEKHWVRFIAFNETKARIFQERQPYFYYEYDIHESSLSKISLEDKELLDVGMTATDSKLTRDVETGVIYYAHYDHVKEFYIDRQPVIKQIRYGGLDYFYWSDHLYISDENTLLRSIRLPGNIETLHVFDDKKYLWITTNNGVYTYDGEMHKIDLPNLHVSYMDIDYEGNYWISTLKQGVFKIPSLAIKRHTSVDSEVTITSLMGYDNKLWIGTAQEQLLCYDSTGVNTIIDSIDNLTRHFHISSIFPRHGKLFLPGGIVSKKGDGNFTYMSYDSNDLADLAGWAQIGSFNLPFGNNKVFSCGPSEGYIVYHLNEQEGEYHHYSTNNNRLLHPSIDSAGVIWAGSLEGVWKIETLNENKTYRWKKHTELNKRINKIIHASNGTKIFATNTGVFFIRGEHLTALNSTNGLLSDVANDILLESDSFLWIGTNKGVSRVTFDETGQRVVCNIDESKGLIGNYVYTLALVNQLLFLATEEGLCSISLKKYDFSSVKPKVMIRSVEVGSDNYSTLLSGLYSHKQNNITIGFDGLSSSIAVEKPFKYRLIRGEDEASTKTYNLTDGSNVNLVDLAPGKYVFQVSCRNRNNVWSDPQTYTFEIIPHFTDTLWFRIAMYLLIALLVAGGFYLRLKEIRRRNERDRQLAELEFKFKESELAILRNQMNPHFMFNALNSIQSYILKSDRDTASHYVQRFSKLMRSSLELSMDDWISLAVEIDFLTNYLTMEKMRFPERFTFEIQVDPDLDPHDILLPPFLIQPIVENSVKHAFKNRETGGVITIGFAPQNGEVLCTVTDNGVGVNQGNLSKPKTDHKSYGIEVVRNRLRLILRDENAEPLRYTDINTIDNNQTGTKVEIRIPIE